MTGDVRLILALFAALLIIAGLGVAASLADQTPTCPPQPTISSSADQTIVPRS